MQNVIKTVVFILLVSLSIEAKENRFTTSVSLLGMSMDYREYDRSGKILDSEMSSFTEMLGVDIGMSFLMYQTSDASTKLQTNLITLSGNTDYVGSLLDDPTCSEYGCHKSRTVNNIIDFDVKIIRTKILTQALEVNYLLGLGYHYWDRQLSVSQVEGYEWYSLRAGVGLGYQISQKFKIATDLEYQYGFKHTMTSSYPVLDVTLGSADIMKLSIPLRYTLNNKMDFIMSYIYEIQEIGASNVQTASYKGTYRPFYEPQSTAKNQYIKIGLDFKY